MNTTDETLEARLKNIEALLAAFKHWKLKAGDFIEDSHVPDMEWLITELKSSLAREKIMRDCLETITSIVVISDLGALQTLAENALKDCEK